ncbi:hypothetical protein B0T22DRAFT_481682 [Podospora appendiculata]|uniref:Uncharacterized protein n=1 Tax=Podospora appendiculata TaxID=314037 RepID=A0AAE0XDE2_9PEZI|nr:hypothetical protein B0T22DRAFT_481682 [Podospora appendiculata]
MAITNKAVKRGYNYQVNNDAANGPDRLFTPREQELIVYSLICMSDVPAPDYTKLAGYMRMSNVRSASNAWNALRKKINEIGKANQPGGDNAEVKSEKSTSPAPALATPAKAKPGRKRKAPSVQETPEGSADDADASAAAATPGPAKRPRGRPRKTNPAISSPHAAAPATKAKNIKKEATEEDAGSDLEDMKPKVTAGRKKLVGSAPARGAAAAAKKAEQEKKAAQEAEGSSEVEVKEEDDDDAEAQLQSEEAEAEAGVEADDGAQKADVE